MTRERTQNAIPSKYRGPGRVRQARRLIDQQQAGAGFTGGFWTRAKAQLRREASWKCAYCEAPTATVTHADVEHYRPKSTYWWLAYCYDNYLYSCEICNQSYKGTAFPVAGAPLALDPPFPDPFPEGMTSSELDALADRLAPDPIDGADVRERFYGAARAERPAIPNPYEFDPSAVFAWEPDDVLREVRLVPSGSGAEAERVVEACEAYLGLNREELLRVRWETYEKAATFAEVLSDGGLRPETLRRVQGVLGGMAEDAAPFAGMVRFFLRRWSLSDLLPAGS